MPPLEHQFGSTQFQTSISGLLKFEVKSWLGRILFKPRAPVEKYIHIGAGETVLPNFENLDFYRFRPEATSKHRVGHDLRYPLPYPDQTFSGAYSEHTLEHLYPGQAVALLKEVCRVLKPGAVFRCTVPDLKKYVDFYVGKEVDAEFRKFSSGCEAIWSLTQNWVHLSVWDASMLSQKMIEAGFKTAAEKKFREGENPDLLMDTEARRWETLYVEAVR